MLLNSLTNLKVLTLHEDSSSFRPTFRKLLANATQLEELYLLKGGVLNGAIVTVIGDLCPNLKVLQFTARSDFTLELPQKSLIHLSNKCTSLEKFSCHNLNISGEFLSEFGKNCPQLKDLSISKYKFWKSVHKDNIIDHPWCTSWNLPSSNKITILRLVCVQMTEPLVELICQSCPNLITLDISDNDRLSDYPKVLTYLQQCVNLTELNISSIIYLICTDFIRDVQKFCPNLRKLYMFTTKRVGYPYIQRLDDVIKHNTQLIEVGVSEGPNYEYSFKKYLCEIKTLNVVLGPYVEVFHVPM
jgi:hypothetical protein